MSDSQSSLYAGCSLLVLVLLSFLFCCGCASASYPFNGCIPLAKKYVDTVEFRLVNGFRMLDNFSFIYLMKDGHLGSAVSGDRFGRDDSLIHTGKEWLVGEGYNIALIPLVSTNKSIGNCENFDVCDYSWTAVLSLAMLPADRDTSWAYAVSYSPDGIDWRITSVNMEGVNWLPSNPTVENLQKFIAAQEALQNKIVPDERLGKTVERDPDDAYLSFDSIKICREALEKYVGGVPPALEGL